MGERGVLIRLRKMEFLDIVDYIRGRYGINLEKKKVLIECRLRSELDRYGIASFKDYMKAVRADESGQMAGEMINRLTTNYTYFMREFKHFDFIRETILPAATAKNKADYQAWCAGCASGEECYTLAMIFQDYREENSAMPAAHITATDISEGALEHARQGIYPMKELGTLPPKWQEKYCTVRDEKSFEIKKLLKKDIQFKNQNLMEPEGIRKRYDLILCRNVMIYFDADSKKAMISRLENSLKPGGYLIVGLAEVLPREFTTLEFIGAAIYRKPE